MALQPYDRMSVHEIGKSQQFKISVLLYKLSALIWVWKVPPLHRLIAWKYVLFPLCNVQKFTHNSGVTYLFWQVYFF